MITFLPGLHTPTTNTLEAGPMDVACNAHCLFLHSLTDLIRRVARFASAVLRARSHIIRPAEAEPRYVLERLGETICVDLPAWPK